MMKKYLFLAFICLYPVTPTQAQHSLVLQKLNEWNDAAPVPRTERIKEEILNTARKIYEQNDACSSSAIVIERVHPATADRFVFNAVLRQQMRNAWTVMVRLPGCDTVPVRFMVMQNMDKSLKTIRVNRGSSYAPNSMFGDTLPLAVLAATTALEREGVGCKIDDGFKLGVTRIEFEEDGLGANLFGVRYRGSWGEIWPIETCGRTIEVLVKFTAHGDGGAYTHLPGDKVTILPK